MKGTHAFLFFFLMGVMDSESQNMNERMAPGIRAMPASLSYPERRRPVRVPVSSAPPALPIDFLPQNTRHTNDRPRNVGPFDASALHTRPSNSGPWNTRRDVPLDDRRNPPVTSSDRLRPTLGGDGAALLVDTNFDEMNVNAMMTISKVSTVEEFARLLGVELPSEAASLGSLDAAAPSSSMSIAPRFGVQNEEARILQSAGCAPEHQTVPLELEPQLGVIYFPTCVRLPRCGGCCPSRLLECKPTEVKPVTLKVLRIQQEVPSGRAASLDVAEGRSRRRRPRPTNSRRRRGTSSSYVMVDQEEHTACLCQCRVQEQDCNPLTHVYVQSDCQCSCKNQDERTKCEEKSYTHFWDEDDCACYCHSPDNCSTGHYFDHNTCSCSSIPVRGRSAANVAIPPNGRTRRPSERVPVVFDSAWRPTHIDSVSAHQPLRLPYK